MNKTVTALIPTYRRPELLSRAISSVLKQTYSHIQVSVFDNASGDTTQRVVDELKKQDPRISYHCHQENIGVLKNFKYAFQSINTPYFSVLSDDDVLVSTFYENAVKILEQNDDIMFVVLNTLDINKDADLIGDQPCTQKIRYYRTPDKFITSNIPSTWTGMLFRRELADIYLNMDDRFDIAADMRFLIHVKARYNFAHLSVPGAFFTNHDASVSANRKRFDVMHHVVQISRYIEIYNDQGVDLSVKNDITLIVRKMLSPGHKQSVKTFFETIKIALKKICENTHLHDPQYTTEVSDAKQAGFTVSAVFLHQIYCNKMIRCALKFAFLPYYRKLKLRQERDMLQLQNGPYKEIFDELKSITPSEKNRATQS